MTEEQIKSDIRMVLENSISNYFDVKYDTYYKEKKLTIAIYKDGRLIQGISEETYNKYRDFIEQELQKIKEKEQEENWVVKALTDSLVIQATAGEDGCLYTLSARVPDSLFKKLNAHYIKSEEDMENYSEYSNFVGEDFRGWVVSQSATEICRQEAEKVATEKQREIARKLIAKREERIRQEKEKEQRRKELKELLASIVKEFQNAEKPDPQVEQPENAVKYQKGFEKMRVDGEVIYNPFNSSTIYGGGEWFVIQHDYIWYILNNGHDGDDWSLNNVETGGAGAVGVRVPYSDELAKKIRSLRGDENLKEG